MKNIYKRVIHLGVLYILVLLGQGCNAVNPHEQVPTYIHVDSFAFRQNLPGTSVSHQVKTVWAYYNNNLIGVFDLPATIPVITKGDTATGTLLLAPGILVNGRNENLYKYGFYTLDTLVFAAKPGKVINHIPVTGFYSAVKITTISNFEGGGLTGFGTCQNTKPMTVVGDSLAFEGKYSGDILLGVPVGSSSDSSLDSTTKRFSIPYGATAFIEFDYKCTIPFFLGLQANQGTVISTSVRYLTEILPGSSWQKFYLFVGDFATSFPGTDYTLYIKASLPEGNASGGRVLIDNIQLVSF